jgi:hypothetical protein
MMLVKELIAKLQECRPDAIVGYIQDDYGFCDITRIEYEKVSFFSPSRRDVLPLEGNIISLS